MLMTSLQGDHFEIGGGKLALEKGRCPAVARLAKRLVKDHSTSLAEDTKLAHRLGVKVPSGPTPLMRWELQQVGSLTGTAFDQGVRVARGERPRRGHREHHAGDHEGRDPCGARVGPQGAAGAAAAPGALEGGHEELLIPHPGDGHRAKQAGSAEGIPRPPT
jgi:hypothetical protein